METFSNLDKIKNEADVPSKSTEPVNPFLEKSSTNNVNQSEFKLKSTTEMENTGEQLKFQLDADIRSCDISWSLFICALNSYRFDTCLRPYPSNFYSNGFKDPKRLKAVCGLVPDMITLQNEILNSTYNEEMMNLLHWVLVQQRDPYLKFIDHRTSFLDEYLPDEGTLVKPNYIFELIYSEAQEDQWMNRKMDKGDSIYAFHGSRLDNFYSIVKFGLQQHMSCTETLFGSGIYLTSELTLSLTYSRSGTAWKNSMFGEIFSAVALCEIINDSENVKCRDATNRNRSINIGSIGGSVPDKYYIVLNSDLVRVRYLLIFKDASRCSPRLNQLRRASSYQWILDHKMTLLLVFYTLLLLMIGFFNSSVWYRYKRIFKLLFHKKTNP